MSSCNMRPIITDWTDLVCWVCAFDDLNIISLNLVPTPAYSTDRSAKKWRMARKRSG
jgi:hypothetical protein